MPTGDSNKIVFYYSTEDGYERLCSAESITHFPEAVIEVPADQDFSMPFDWSMSFTCKTDRKRLRRFLRSVGFVGAENLFPKKHRKARRARRREKVRRARNERI